MGADLFVLILAVLGAAGGAGAAFYVLGRRAERQLAEAAGRSAEQRAERLLGDAKREADAARAQAVLDGKETAIKLKENWDQEEKRRREELDRQQERVVDRETLIDRKLNALDDRDKELKRREQSVRDKEKHLSAREDELVDAEEQHRRRLEELSGLSKAEAKDLLVKEMTDVAKSEASALIRDIKEEAKRGAEREAKKIISLAVQRIASEHAASISVSAVALPSDEMKGRIIGREGRNIRAFDQGI